MIRMGRRRFIASAAVFAACAPRARAANPHDADLVTVGNSLIDQSVDMAHFFARARGGAGRLSHQTIPGASMRWNWDNAGTAVVNGRAALARGEGRIWMGVERVPFRAEQGPGAACDVTAWSDWGRLAAGNGVTRALVFEAWHDLRSGQPAHAAENPWDPDADVPWRERLDAARPSWAGIADHLASAGLPGDPEIALVPGGRMLAVLHDDIRQGAAPEGLEGIGDLFADTIHPDIRGRYALACLMYACLYRRSPEGLPATTADVWDRPFPPVPPRMAGYFQKRAWEVARAEPRSGLA